MPLSLHAAMALSVGVGPADAARRRARPGELAMVGPLALASIAALRFDTVVLGCCGVSPEGHVMAHDLGDAAVKQALRLGRSQRARPGGAKFGRPRWRWSGAVDFDVVVTDDTAPE